MLKKSECKQMGRFNTLSHGLYFNPAKFQVDFRSRLGKALKGIVGALLGQFPSPCPPAAQLLAQRTAFKLVRAASYEAFIFNGEKVPPLKADQSYLTLTASIRADFQLLWQMAKDGGGGERVPDLREYLESLKAAAAIPVKPEAGPEPSHACKCSGAGCECGHEETKDQGETKR